MDGGEISTCWQVVTFAAIVFTLASLHLNDSRHYNQINPGFGIEWQTDKQVTATVGGYINSSGRLSSYFCIGRSVGNETIGVGAEAGVVTGYKLPVLPLVFTYFYVSRGRWAMKVNVLPVKRPILGIQLRVAY